MILPPRPPPPPAPPPPPPAARAPRPRRSGGPTQNTARGRTALIALIALAALSAPGCREERIVSRKGMLSGLPGAQTGGIPDVRNITQADVLRTPESGIRQTLPDGTVVLHAKSVQQLMTHIVNTMQNDEEGLFTQQVLSQMTRNEFIVRGYEPREAYKELVRRQRDVFRLFNAMPFGERTPGVYMESIGRNEFRLRLPRSSWGDLQWTGMDVVFENGNYRLRWFTDRSI